MDTYSGKRSVGWNAAPKRKSSSAARNVTSSRDEVQFCTRIGCSGRLNHTNHTRKTSTVEKNELNTLQSSRARLKSKSQDGQPGSNRGALNLQPVGNTVGAGSSSNTKVRKVYGQRSGLAIQDGQSGSFDRGRRNNIVKKRSTEGETSSSASGIGGGGSSVRTRRPANVSRNNPSPIQSTRVITDNVDSIANVLLALERIDQDEGLSFEQILGNSFLSGFNFYDQYRGMRLDIDNMSYEQLLVLEDEMGIVSTALSEEELSKCLRNSVYKPLHIKECKMTGNWCSDDTKCSICQEEFTSGDEIGSMGCDHGYHAACIYQWLRLKNWCPICKAPAQP